MKKVCTACGETKPLTEYYRTARGTGYRGKCKPCYIERFSGSGKKNYDKEKARKRYLENREYQLAKSKEWRLRNPEKAKENNKNYWMTPLKRAKMTWQKAKARKTENFTLSLERVQLAIILGFCEKTGIPFQFDNHEKYHRNPFCPSVDKIDPFGPYSDDNVQIVCWAYNVGKAQMTDDEYIDFCRKVVEADNRRKGLE